MSQLSGFWISYNYRVGHRHGTWCALSLCQSASVLTTKLTRVGDKHKKKEEKENKATMALDAPCNNCNKSAIRHTRAHKNAEPESRLAGANCSVCRLCARQCARLKLGLMPEGQKKKKRVKIKCPTRAQFFLIPECDPCGYSCYEQSR